MQAYLYSWLVVMACSSKCALHTDLPKSQFFIFLHLRFHGCRGDGPLGIPSLFLCAQESLAQALAHVLVKAWQGGPVLLER